MARVCNTYRVNRETGEHKWVFDRFAEATALLLDSTDDGSGAPDFKDLLGQIYMSWGWPSKSAGQYFTPWEICVLMAKMTGSPEAEVYARLRAAVEKSPLAQAAVIAGLALQEPEERWQHFIRMVVPLAYEHYEPVKVCDPCVGSGAMLLAHASQVPHWMNHLGLIQYYGQDIDPTCVAMARLNLRIYGLGGYGLQLELTAAEMVNNLSIAAPAPRPAPMPEPEPLPAEALAQLSLFQP